MNMLHNYTIWFVCICCMYMLYVYAVCICCMYTLYVYAVCIRCIYTHTHPTTPHRHAYHHVGLLLHCESHIHASVGSLAPSTPRSTGPLSPQHHFLKYYHFYSKQHMSIEGRLLWGSVSCQPRLKTLVDIEGEEDCVEGWVGGCGWGGVDMEGEDVLYRYW